MKFVVGVDESGCGALAGPLVVCAAAFPVGATRVEATWRGVRGDKVLRVGDSKGVKDAEHRAFLAEAVRAASPAISVIERSSAEIDARLLGSVFPEAVALAASRCLERLKIMDASLLPSEVIVLVDGDVVRPELPCEVRCIPHGDRLEWQIGAASIVAKATHDKRIDELHKEYPNWGFDRSRGYPTKEHKAFLHERGPILVHRKSYRPVRDAMPRTIGIEE